MSEQSRFENAPGQPAHTDVELEQTLPEENTHASEIPEQTQTSPNQPQVPTEDFEAGVLAQLDSLYRTALRMTNNPQEAEDLVQETMLKAFRFAHTYQPGTNLRAWLFRILNTSAINRYRKQATHPTPTSLPEGEEFYLYNQIRDLSGQELSQGAEEEVLNQYLDEDVYKALNDLPPNFRMAVILADIEGLSYKEIAEALQIPIGTVMSRISRARRQLQKSLWQYAKERGYVKAS
jgi:RNA polymerase sigma-70 factor (ECF subfamily)